MKGFAISLLSLFPFLKLSNYSSHSILGKAPWHCVFTGKGGKTQLSIHAITFQVD